MWPFVKSLQTLYKRNTNLQIAYGFHVSDKMLNRETDNLIHTYIHKILEDIFEPHNFISLRSILSH